ncbi:phosphatase PAP2 family protein [Streptomyces sp. 8L]|nr:phosphatase PAP2 family protein [Streptomyces sp. 8L]MCA1224180.1 phosphatase PAP2 family protein [Streptomyces sp. 8L]
MPAPARLRLAAASACAVLFALITWQVLARGPLLRLDERLDRTVVGHGPKPVTAILTDLGSMPVALPVLALALAWALWRGARASVLAGALTMAAVPALVVPLKIWTDRPGPLTDATGYYPSGHTATAMVAYGTAALVLLPYAGRRATVPAAALLTVATAVALVLRGYHWPLDVIASGALCGLLLLALGAVLRRLAARGTPPGTD